MTYAKTCDEYYLKKMSLFKQFLNLSEEFFSNIEDWESYEDHLTKRESVLNELRKLEEVYGKDMVRFCSDSQRQEMDHMVDLILALDRDLIEAISKNRLQTLKSISSAVTEKKITTGYSYGDSAGQNGRLLDRKW